MNVGERWVLAVAVRGLAALAVAAAACALAFGYVSFTQRPIAIIYTNDTQGALEPCG